jgi:hypothetical protein
MSYETDFYFTWHHLLRRTLVLEGKLSAISRQLSAELQQLIPDS